MTTLINHNVILVAVDVVLCTVLHHLHSDQFTYALQAYRELAVLITQELHV